MIAALIRTAVRARVFVLLAALALLTIGVIAVRSGAAALTGDANTAAAAAPDAFRIVRLEIFPSRIVSFLVGSRVVQRSSTRHRSAGRVSHTLLPGAMFASGEVTTRICVPSPISTI